MATYSNAIKKVYQIYYSKLGTVLETFGDTHFNAQDDEVAVIKAFIEDGVVDNVTTLINFTPEGRSAFTSHWFPMFYRGLQEKVVSGEAEPRTFAQFEITLHSIVLLMNGGKTSVSQDMTVIQRYGSVHLGNFATITDLNANNPASETYFDDSVVAFVYSNEAGQTNQVGFYQVEEVEEVWTWVLKTTLLYTLLTKQYNGATFTVGRGPSNPQGVPTVSQSLIYQLMQEISYLDIGYQSLDVDVTALKQKMDLLDVTQKTLLYQIEMEFGTFDSTGGELVSDNKLRSKDFLSVVPGRTINLSNNSLYNMYVLVYDNDKNWISTTTPINGSGTYVIPENGYYFRIRTSTDEISKDAIFTYSFSGKVITLIADLVETENAEIQKLKVLKIDLGNGYKLYSDIISGETDLYEAVLEALENEFNVFTIKAPEREPKEATITLKLGGDGVTNQFVDLACMRYDNQVQGAMEIVMQKRGSTTPLPYFTINFNDGEGAGRIKKFTVQPDAIPIEMVSTGIKVRRNNNYNNTGTEAEYQVINLTDLYDDVEGIKNGTTTVKKAEQDGSGNTITTTYETKADATSKKSEIDGRLNTAESDITALDGRLDTAEGKVSTLETEVQALEDANMIKSYTYNPATHVLVFTYFDGTTTSFDLPLESAIIDASYDNVTKDITFVLQSGATLVVPLDDLVSGLASETWVTTYFIPKTALKTSFSATPLDTNVISEKLAKDTFDTKEALANKAIDFSTVNDTKYPTTKAVSTELAKKIDKRYITNLVTNGDGTTLTSWSVGGLVTIENNTFKIDSSSAVSLAQNVSILQTQIIHYRILYKGDGLAPSSNLTFQLRNATNVISSNVVLLSNANTSWTLARGAFTLTDTITNMLLARSGIGSITFIDNIQLFNLTASHGVTTTSGTAYNNAVAEIEAELLANGGYIDGTKELNIYNVASVKANIAQEAWLTPTLTSATSTYIRYRKDTLGTVIVEGNITVTTAGTNLTLPVGYRPLFSYTVGILTFNTDGTVVSSATGTQTLSVRYTGA